MKAYDAMAVAWRANSAHMTSALPFQLILSGRLTRCHYAAMLRQIFHHARENPQLQAMATARFRGEERGMVAAFLRHAASEIGHDQLALNDIAALGEDVDGISEERPLPATFALLASAFHMIEHHSPLAYLGYLFHLEFTPIQLGHDLMVGLERSGIPRDAMTFLAEHARVDIAHCKLMEKYCERLLRSPEDLEAALYMQRLTSELYSNMLGQAIESADRWQGLTSVSPQERRRSRLGVTAACRALEVA